MIIYVQYIVQCNNSYQSPTKITSSWFKLKSKFRIRNKFQKFPNCNFLTLMIDQAAALCISKWCRITSKQMFKQILMSHYFTPLVRLVPYFPPLVEIRNSMPLYRLQIGPNENHFVWIKHPVFHKNKIKVLCICAGHVAWFQVRLTNDIDEQLQFIETWNQKHAWHLPSAINFRCCHGVSWSKV